MAWKKTQDLCVVVRRYKDSTGADKNQYENIGSVMEDDKGERMYFIKRSFNPAGVPFKEGSDTILISRFDVKEKNSATQAAAAPAQQQPSQFTSADMDSDVPF